MTGISSTEEVYNATSRFVSLLWQMGQVIPFRNKWFLKVVEFIPFQNLVKCCRRTSLLDRNLFAYSLNSSSPGRIYRFGITINTSCMWVFFPLFPIYLTGMLPDVCDILPGGIFARQIEYTAFILFQDSSSTRW